ncbi:BT4734/BF3469 family protein [Cyclobacterium xiamenense]|uniref:BT4734/BF3469 family protein n=1 Tax=Cyclobacterium xiamenense TaxID=1297121 RepID=UPI0012B9E8E4|nr:BT4734/BF3469 family protein [Cyclobacterium xiamenense]
MEIKDILNTQISYQDHFWTPLKTITIRQAFTEIKGDKHLKYTKFLRNYYLKGDKENYAISKRKLPVVTFCGTYEKERTKENLKDYNSLVVLDIDKLGNDELKRVKGILSNDVYVLSFWESPSKDGIKGLVHLKYKFEIQKYGFDTSHKIAFKQLVDYFKENYQIELDISGSDITRLCFISWDDKITVKDCFDSFTIKEISNVITSKNKVNPKAVKNIKVASSKDLLNNPFGKNSQYHRKTIKNITNYLTKNSLSITKSYADWLRVAFAIANSFTFEVGKKYFLALCKLDLEKFNEVECNNLLINCYENSRGEIGFNTIIHLATLQGYKYKINSVEST